MDKNDPVVQEFIGYWRLSDLGMDLSHRVFFLTPAQAKKASIQKRGDG